MSKALTIVDDAERIRAKAKEMSDRAVDAATQSEKADDPETRKRLVKDAQFFASQSDELYDIAKQMLSKY